MNQLYTLQWCIKIGGLVVICTLSATLGDEGVQRAVQSGRQALQTGPAQYCEEMEFAV